MDDSVPPKLSSPTSNSFSGLGLAIFIPEDLNSPSRVVSPDSSLTRIPDALGSFSRMAAMPYRPYP